MMALAAYEQAQEFSHFGAELADSAKADLARGKWLHELFIQAPGETYSVMMQQLMLAIVLETVTTDTIDIQLLKRQARQLAKDIKADTDFETAKAELQKQAIKGPAAA
jgi:F0F1-type ATP synthase alpha subunit